MMQSMERLIRAHSRVEELRAKKLDLSLAEARYLQFFDGDELLTVKCLSESMALVKSRITRITDGLVLKGLIERHNHPEDGRICVLKLTPLGREKLGDLSECCREAVDFILMRISSREQMILLDTLEELSQCLEELSVRDGKLIAVEL